MSLFSPYKFEFERKSFTIFFLPRSGRTDSPRRHHHLLFFLYIFYFYDTLSSVTCESFSFFFLSLSHISLASVFSSSPFFVRVIPLQMLLLLQTTPSARISVSSAHHPPCKFRIAFSVRNEQSNIRLLIVPS